MNYYVYIITSRNNNVLYVGVTNSLVRRTFEHKNKIISGFSAKYNLSKPVYYEITSDIKSAIEREKQIKNWHRSWKIDQINKFNPTWKDLYLELI